LAKYVSAANQGENPLVLTTLASAYAEAGDFDKAVETATRALEIAQRNGDQRLADELERRLELFRDQRAFRFKPRG
jgi:tetratricopeptide (TPR) repeat protein